MNRSTKDLWIEMSIREIWTQTRFAKFSFKNIDEKSAANDEALFSSIHSFLSHCGVASKMASAKVSGAPPKTIGDILGIPSTSMIHQKDVRNSLEHYYQRLQNWIDRHGPNPKVSVYGIGPIAQFHDPSTIIVSNYDPLTSVFTVVGDKVILRDLHDEVQRIEKLASGWVEGITGGTITPPFG